MRRQPGTSGLRALLYIDELQGILPPHPATPPTKPPLLTLLKQGRAFGVGVWLSSQNPVDVDYKAPRDPVTEADRRANALICESLARAFPGVPVVAEESDPSAFAGYRDAPRAFFVDPLDGTREFVKKNGEFVMMIGLLEAGRPQCGVIFAPATGTRSLSVVTAGGAPSGARCTALPLRSSKFQ